MHLVYILVGAKIYFQIGISNRKEEKKHLNGIDLNLENLFIFFFK